MPRKGCLRYEYSFGVVEDELLLTEVWRDAEAIEVHKNSVHFAKLGELKAEYVENTEFMKFKKIIVLGCSVNSFLRK